VKVLETVCLTLLEDIQIAVHSLLLLSYSFGSVLYHCTYGCMFCMILFNFVNYFYYNVFVLLLLCMFRSKYSVSLLCSVFCLCVNVYCSTATGC
jgi:hypothetical protein